MVDCGTITIVEERPQYNIVDCSVSQTEVGADDEIRATATVENNGNADGGADLVWLANGQQVDSSRAEIRAGNSTSLTGIFTPSSVGISSGSIDVTVEVRNLQTQSAGLFR